ncbi:MAG: hypothetical protein FJ104_06870, partial [Deltaproteobacteria bacterium]|nr:hypothetical protein [Deltaproteobacteria bacterium]
LARRKIALPASLHLTDDPEVFPIARYTGSIRLPSGTVLVAGVSALFGLKITSWRPGKNMRNLRAPMLVCVCEQDSVAPPGPTIAYARASSRCELRGYPYGHFDIYVGKAFEDLVADQLEFLGRVVPLSAARAA